MVPTHQIRQDFGWCSTVMDKVGEWLWSQSALFISISIYLLKEKHFCFILTSWQLFTWSKLISILANVLPHQSWHYSFLKVNCAALQSTLTASSTTFACVCIIGSKWLILCNSKLLTTFFSNPLNFLQSLNNQCTCAVCLERLWPLDPRLTLYLPSGLVGSGVDGCSHTRCGRLLISSQWRGREERGGQERGVEM